MVGLLWHLIPRRPAQCENCHHCSHHSLFSQPAVRLVTRSGRPDRHSGPLAAATAVKCSVRSFVLSIASSAQATLYSLRTTGSFLTALGRATLATTNSCRG